MAVEHMVWFKFKDSIPETRREEHRQKLYALVGVVPQIRRLEAGFNFTQRARGFHLGLTVTVDSPAALDEYQVHPAHAAVGKALREDCDDVIALDFERA